MRYEKLCNRSSVYWMACRKRQSDERSVFEYRGLEEWMRGRMEIGRKKGRDEFSSDWTSLHALTHPSSL